MSDNSSVSDERMLGRRRYRSRYPAAPRGEFFVYPGECFHTLLRHGGLSPGGRRSPGAAAGRSRELRHACQRSELGGPRRASRGAGQSGRQLPRAEARRFGIGWCADAAQCCSVVAGDDQRHSPVDHGRRAGRPRRLAGPDTSYIAHARSGQRRPGAWRDRCDLRPGTGRVDGECNHVPAGGQWRRRHLR